MAFFGYCEQCHYLFASVRRRAVRIHLTEHCKKCHKGKERFFIVDISAKVYQDYLASKDNPAFWTAWDNIKKSQLIAKIYPFLV